MSARAVLAWLVLGAAAACADAGPVGERIFAMGTWVDVEIVEADRASATAALDDVERMLRRFERDYHAWNDGELAALNTAIREGRAFEASDGLAGLLAETQRLAAASRGTFDPGVGALVELWGFDDAASAASPPPAPRIDEWLARGDSIAALQIDDGVVRSDSRTLQIDLGGIAKGEAVDRVVELLRARSIERALVNAGGDVRALGRRAERPWRIGIRAPRDDGLLGAVELEPGEAVFTSGDYERFFVHEGRREHHILDPATGRPVRHTQAVTVLAADGVTADAAATALLVAGPLARGRRGPRRRGRPARGRRRARNSDIPNA